MCFTVWSNSPAQPSQQLRGFREIDTLVLYLQHVGVSCFEVDTAGN
ncbi:hypothetical protein [Aeromonas hydrophila]|nr:hypothetical protein [Aeromonas hydrophila]